MVLLLLQLGLIKVLVEVLISPLVATISWIKATLFTSFLVFWYTKMLRVHTRFTEPIVFPLVSYHRNFHYILRLLCHALSQWVTTYYALKLALFETLNRHAHNLKPSVHICSTNLLPVITSSIKWRKLNPELIGILYEMTVTFMLHLIGVLLFAAVGVVLICPIVSKEEL